MRKMIVAALVACACSLSAAAQKKEKQVVVKEEVKPEEGKGGPHGMRALDLTADQKKKMKEIHLRTGKEVMLLKNQLGEKQAHLKTLTTSDKPDMNEINKTIDEMASLKAQIVKKRIGAKMEVRGMLNDEQKLMFDMHSKKRERKEVVIKKRMREDRGRDDHDMHHEE